MPDIVSIYAPSWDPYDSYGMIAGHLAKAADRRGWHVNAFQRHGQLRHETHDETMRHLIGQPIRPAFGGLMLGYPTEHASHGPLAMAGPRVAVTMFESTQLPPTWAGPLNRCEAVIVPSAWLVQVFRNSGVTVPIYVVPLGIDEVFTPGERKRQVPYTFLANADRMDWNRRKGWDVAVCAFEVAFCNRSDVRLVFKARERSKSVQFTNNNIVVVQADLTPAALNAFYHQADCMVFPTRGEGFGLPPREFAATGGLVLATAWGGTADDIDAWGVPIPYTLKEAWHPNDEKHGPGLWAEPDVDALAALMVQAATRPADWERHARQAAERVRALYRWDCFTDRVLDIWQQVVHREAVHA